MAGPGSPWQFCGSLWPALSGAVHQVLAHSQCWAETFEAQLLAGASLLPWPGLCAESGLAWGSKRVLDVGTARMW